MPSSRRRMRMRPPTWTSTGFGVPVPRPYGRGGAGAARLDFVTTSSHSSLRPGSAISPSRAAMAKPRRSARDRLGLQPGLAQGGEVVLVEGLALQEQTGASFQDLALSPQQVHRSDKGLVDHRLDGGIDLARGLLAVAALGPGRRRRA